MNIESLSVQECDPNPFSDYPTLESSMRDGAVIHCFRSGGGLRVVRLEKPRHGELLGYGEHPHIEQAFDYCEEDALLGRQDYSLVYGTKYPHYLTGSSTPSSEVDRWVLGGRDTDFTFKDGQFVFRGSYLKDAIPREVLHRVTETRVAEDFVDDRGIHFRVKPSVAFRDRPSASASIVSKPEGGLKHNSFMCECPVVSRNPTLRGLLEQLNGSLGLTWRN